MNRDNYISAMNKVKASSEFKERVIRAAMERETAMNEKKPFKRNISTRMIASFAALVLVISFGYLGNIYNKNKEIDPSESISEGSYIMAVYLDGFMYEDTGWMSYSREIKNLEEIKDEKLGEVTLDLKDKPHAGTPPDFSSTLGVGTELYSIKGVKKENSILFVSGDLSGILYRSRKAVATVNEPINLTISDVYNMISDNPTVKAVELRNEIDGSWMRDSMDEKLINLLNDEIKKENILNNGEIDEVKVSSSYRIPVNLIFEDGAMLHMQIYPETKTAYVFGGYINISQELSDRLEELNSLGFEYEKIMDIGGYKQEDIGYLEYINHRTGEEIISNDPQWSGEALYWQLNYFSVDNINNGTLEGERVISIKLGTSESEYTTIELYEDGNNHIFFKANDITYRIVKGNLSYNEMVTYQDNYTAY